MLECALARRFEDLYDLAKAFEEIVGQEYKQI